MASKANLSIVKAVISSAVISAEATAIAIALVDLRASEDAYDRINAALAAAKAAGTPWGDARKPAAGGLVMDIRAGLKAKLAADKRDITPESFDNNISLIGWCYKNGNRLQTMKAQVQQGKAKDKPITQLDLVTGAPKTVKVEAPQKAPTKRNTREKDCADFFLKATEAAGYVQVMGFVAAAIRTVGTKGIASLNADMVHKLIMEANVKAKRLVEKDGAYKHV